MTCLDSRILKPSPACLSHPSSRSSGSETETTFSTHKSSLRAYRLLELALQPVLGGGVARQRSPVSLLFRELYAAVGDMTTLVDSWRFMGNHASPDASFVMHVSDRRFVACVL
ncbi:hypothetical protein J3459_022542 [Metarhizium acridum]|nr:hypothetical protein J3459_022542 [Metarhizium acridum]